jgi:hypothetical protein
VTDGIVIYLFVLSLIHSMRREGRTDGRTRGVYCIAFISLWEVIDWHLFNRALLCSLWIDGAAARGEITPILVRHLFACFYITILSALGIDR